MAASRTKSKSNVDTDALARFRKGGEITGLFLLALAVGLFLSLVTSNPADVTTAGEIQNWIGPVGAYAADILLYIFGVGAFCLTGVLFVLGGFMLVGRRPELKPSEFVGHGLLVISGALLCQLLFTGTPILGHPAGGLVGELIGGLSQGMIGIVGSYIFGACMALLSVMLITDRSLGAMLRSALGWMRGGTKELGVRWRARREYKRMLRQKQLELDAELDDEAPEDTEDDEVRVAAIADRKLKAKERREAKKRAKEEEKAAKEAGNAADDTGGDPDDSPELAENDEFVFSGTLADLENAGEPSFDGVVGLDEDDDTDAGRAQVEQADTGAAVGPLIKNDPTGAVDDGFGPAIVETEAQQRQREKRQALQANAPLQLELVSRDKSQYELPPLNFLDYDVVEDIVIDKDKLREQAMSIEEKLSNFGVDGKVVEICPGPVITMFEFAPAPGVKLSRIAGLSDDLAMALAALSVRIIAPIPGKGVVGIEVPNDSREMVFMKEIVADEAFQTSKARMPLALGKDTEGSPVVADLAAMPHLLVAGATGSGKSVAVNTMIVSLLFRFTPEDVRLIMVDPKMLEFSIYEGIPHLLLPVVTDPNKAATALRWAVEEMERRYALLANMGVRNVSTYNKRVLTLTKQCELDVLEGREGTEAMQKMQFDHNGKPKHRKLPYIVCIIDEFADLMMVAPKDVEMCVARLAQKARAAGLHLILATQRPSVNVITGLIKANFPTRIALRVAQKTDSRVILDGNGAETLLGKGDMLFLPPGASSQQRVHGAYVSETEIDRIVGFLKEQGEPQYDDSILTAGEEGEGGGGIEDEEADEHYDEAIFIVTSERTASISMLQRKLRIGYNRAARIIERMEADGIVAASNGPGRRKVLAPPPPGS
jgi:DNA segregation ATPase FtsK/SpoIIIE, S-DNA-T family